MTSMGIRTRSLSTRSTVPPLTTPERPLRQFMRKTIYTRTPENLQHESACVRKIVAGLETTHHSQENIVGSACSGLLSFWWVAFNVREEYAASVCGAEVTGKRTGPKRVRRSDLPRHRDSHPGGLLRTNASNSFTHEY
jgi:hypothetical protein